MSVRLSIVSVLCLAVLGASVLAGLASATTNPGGVFRVYVTLTDKGIQTKLFQQTYGQGGLVPTRAAARGNVAVFQVSNMGKKPHNFEVLGFKTPTLRAGKKYSFSLQLLRRGGFQYESTLDKGKAFRGVFDVA
jgi:hypothetical protein